MHAKLSFKHFVFGILLACPVSQVSAADIAVAFSEPTLDNVTRGYFTGAGEFNSGGAVAVQGMRFASSFQMGGTSMSLSSIEVPLLTEGDNTDIEVVFRVYTDNAGSPGTLFATQTNAAFKPNTEYSYYTGTFSTPTLDASSVYWIVVELSATASDVYTSVALTDFSNSTQTTTSGTPNFDAFANEGAGWNSVTNSNYALPLLDPPTTNPYSLVYNVNLTPVPEPSTYALGAIASVVMGVIARRRQKAKSA